jgi:hypothetical protein
LRRFLRGARRNERELPACGTAALSIGARRHFVLHASRCIRPRHGTARNALADSGALEIAPMEAPLTLFVWSKNRVLPVRVTSLSITEEAFDVALNPIRAKVSLGLRVLTVDDVPFAHKAGGLFMSHLQQKEGLSKRGVGAALGALGIGEIP